MNPTSTSRPAPASGAVFSARGADLFSAAIGRRTVLAGGVSGLAALALAACTGSSTAATQATGAAKTELVVAVPALAPTLDGVVGGGGLTLESFEMNANLQAGLVRNPYIDGDTEGTVIQDFNEYVGYLAESYEVSGDGLTYTFRLRPDVVSPLGNPLTADDVLYSFERKWNVATYSKGVWLAGFAGPEAITKVDDSTVAFTLTSAGFGLTFLGLLANLQGHIYDSVALTANTTAEDPYAVNWAKTNGGWGHGPYHVTSQTPDQEMILTANSGYAYGEPSIAKVTLRVVGDAGTRATLVSTGDVDMAEGCRPTDQARLANAQGVVVPSAENPIEYVDLTLVTNKAPFDNELVRQAMAFAIPYDEIMEQIYSGRATATIGNINPSTKGYSVDSLPTYEYDPEKALALLEEAGVDGVAYTLSVSTATTDLVDASVLIQSYAKDAGFDIEINQMPAADFGTARGQATGQAIIYRNRCQVQTPTYSCTIFFKPGNDTSNPSRWEDASASTFWGYVDAAQALPDPLSDEAGELWIQAQTVLIDSAPEIFVCSIQPSQVFRTAVSGFAYRSENAIDFGNIEATE
ncbi:peptide/nickel transport system substrate-binding protein [Rathayibacter oskolensis]|uniref:Peptide/nickel transport system substrate-binding protein n=1 Tax=Rathayibacter oskolensis TaxID=1891671 RepID=A0A1X7PDR6_9MICO|nr:ABC transporter substrate-binding protein [Rathayibacter oskolensis]SMH49511.1 peptide/nickel transport system substrate-binding protein [Rathayibacter oskolensis]